MNTTKIKQDIPKKWRWVKLGDISVITNGKTNTQDAVPNGQYPLFDRSAVIKRSDKYLFDKTAVILPGEGAEFIPRYYSGKFDLHQRAYAIFPNDLVDPTFLYQYLNSNRDVFANNAVGSTVKSLRLPIIKAVDVALPTLLEQQKIAEILSSVDEDILATQKVIEQTEEVKKGLMKDLFTKGIGHTKFKDSEFGMIPESWEIIELQKVAEVNRGKFSHRPRNDARFYGGSYPFIQTGDVVSTKVFISHFFQSLNEKGFSVSRQFPKGTIVMTIAANIGDVGILNFNSCFPDSLVGITVDQNIVDNLYLYYFLYTQKHHLNNISTQSAQKNINLQKLNPLSVRVPPINEQKQIASSLLALDEKISIYRHKNNQLEKVKKGLMSDLLSGNVETN